MNHRLLLSLAEANNLLLHDINNHLQVILGFMQLKKPEKAHEHLLQTIKSLQRFNLLSQIGLPLLQAFLFSCLTRLDELANVIHIQVGNNTKDWLESDIILTWVFMDILIPFGELFKKNELSCEISFLDSSERKIEIYLQSDKVLLHENIDFLNSIKSRYQGLRIKCNLETEKRFCLTIFRDDD